MLVALGRVPLDRHGVRPEREVVEQHPVRDRVALEVVGFAAAEVPVHPVRRVEVAAVTRG